MFIGMSNSIYNLFLGMYQLEGNLCKISASTGNICWGKLGIPIGQQLRPIYWCLFSTNRTCSLPFPNRKCSFSITVVFHLWDPLVFLWNLYTGLGSYSYWLANVVGVSNVKKTYKECKRQECVSWLIRKGLCKFCEGFVYPHSFISVPRT